MIPEGAIGKKIEILFVEDNPSDVRLTMETLKDRKVLDDLSAVGLRWVLKKEDSKTQVKHLSTSGKMSA